MKKKEYFLRASLITFNKDIRRSITGNDNGFREKILCHGHKIMIYAVI